MNPNNHKSLDNSSRFSGIFVIFVIIMVQPRSVLTVADNSGAKRIRVILVHGGGKRKFGHIGDMVSASVIDADSDSQLPTGSKVKAVVVRTRAPVRRRDGSRVRFDDNAAVMLESTTSNNPLGTRVFGPIAREIKDLGYAKISSLAEEVL
jgi:large subunit ribosomal protein L14